MRELKQLKNGKVVELKKDGTPSKRLIRKLRQIEFLGFQVPEVINRFPYSDVEILKGNPEKDKVIVFSLYCSGHKNATGHRYGDWISSRTELTRISGGATKDKLKAIEI